MFFSVSDTGRLLGWGGVGSIEGASRYPRLETEPITQAARKKKIKVLPTKVEPMTF